MLIPEMRDLTNGNAYAWCLAVALLWPVAMRTARRTLGDFLPAEVEDVAVTAIREVAEAVRDHRVDDFHGLQALTVVVARRRALDTVRRESAARRAAGRTHGLEGRNDLTDGTPGPLEQVDAAELARLLADLGKRLAPQSWQVLRAHYLEGRTQQEIAETLGLPLGTVGSVLSRSLLRLRRWLEQSPALMQEIREILR